MTRRSVEKLTGRTSFVEARRRIGAVSKYSGLESEVNASRGEKLLIDGRYGAIFSIPSLPARLHQAINAIEIDSHYIAFYGAPRTVRSKREFK